MYGILLEALVDMLKTRYGEDTWQAIHVASGVDRTNYSAHDIYSETFIPRIVNATAEVGAAVG